MKKLFIALLCALGVLSLAACGENGEGGNKVRKTKVQYCGWDLGTEEQPTLKRLMIEQFNAQSETIRIEMVSPQGGYDEFLNTLAAGGGLPDVFLVNSVPTAVINKLAGDITDLTAADTEWGNVESSLRESITYNDKVYAIPAGQHYLGFLANYDLIDDYATLSSDAETVFEAGKFSAEDFFKVIPEIKNINVNDGTGVIGLNATGDMINWLPSSLDSTGNIKHFVWNGENFDFTSQTMIDALTKIQEIGDVNSKYTFNSLADPSAEEDPRIAIFGTTNENDVFGNGQMAFLQAATYYNFSDLDFEWKFIGYPDGKVVSAADFMCISKACKNREAAYEVAKFLTFGADGINATYEILNKNSDITLTGLPINTDTEITEQWFDYITLPGAEEVYQKVSAGEMEVLVEGLKTVPGFQSARYTYNTGISIEGVRDGNPLTIGDFIWDVCEGKIKMNDYISQMDEAKAAAINKEIETAFAKINELQ